jgi:hypothetical protein
MMSCASLRLCASWNVRISLNMALRSRVCSTRGGNGACRRHWWIASAAATSGGWPAAVQLTHTAAAPQRIGSAADHAAHSPPLSYACTGLCRGGNTLPGAGQMRHAHLSLQRRQRLFAPHPQCHHLAGWLHLKCCQPVQVAFVVS